MATWWRWTIPAGSTERVSEHAGPLDEAALAARARAVLEAHWRPEGGYTVPHAGTYPFQWLWDSCFHAIAWAEA